MGFGARARLVVPVWLAVSSIPVVHACAGNDDDEGSVPPFCADIDDMTTCETRVGCLWDASAETCAYECLPYEDQASCEAQASCEWLDDTCVHGSL